jgi:hypothetical protein
VRLTVEAVERHVPSSVRVELLDLLSDLESLGSQDDEAAAQAPEVDDAATRTAGDRTGADQ